MYNVHPHEPLAILLSDGAQVITLQEIAAKSETFKQKMYIFTILIFANREVEFKAFPTQRKKLLQRHFVEMIGKVKHWLGIHTPVQLVIFSEFSAFEGAIYIVKFFIFIGDLAKLRPPFPAKVHFVGCGEYNATDEHFLAMKQFSTIYRGGMYHVSSQDVNAPVQELVDQHCALLLVSAYCICR